MRVDWFWTALVCTSLQVKFWWLATFSSRMKVWRWDVGSDVNLTTLSKVLTKLASCDVSLPSLGLGACQTLLLLLQMLCHCSLPLCLHTSQSLVYKIWLFWDVGCTRVHFMDMYSIVCSTSAHAQGQICATGQRLLATSLEHSRRV